MRQLVQRVFELASQLPTRPAVFLDETPIYELEDDGAIFDLRMEDGAYMVSGERIERAAAMTYWDYEEAVSRFHKTLEALGVVKALEEAGVKQGDTVYIGDFELEWSE